jgi:hypothetical protein
MRERGWRGAKRGIEQQREEERDEGKRGEGYGKEEEEGRG